MKIRKSYLAILLSVITAVLLIASQSVLVWADSDPQQIYDDNGAAVEAIDGGGYFARLLDLAKEDAAYTAVMERVAAVANDYAEYVAAFDEADYLASDWADISKTIELTAVAVRLNQDNYKTYNADGAYTAKIASDGELIRSKHSTMQALYDAKKENAAADFAAKYADTLKVNEANPSGSPEKLVGYYDRTGLEFAEVVEYNFNSDLAMLKLDKADYKGSVAAIDALVADAKAELAAVRKNVVERAYDELQDFYAIQKGTKTGNVEAQKNVAAQAIDGTVTFFANASAEVLKEYSNQKKAFDDFFDENEIDDSAYINRETIRTDDGAVIVTAYDQSGNKLPVFNAHTYLKITDVVLTSPKRHNAEVLVNKDNSSLSVAYFVDVAIFSGVAVAEPVTEYEGKKVKYVVELDLAAYYNGYVAGNKTFITNLLGLYDKTPQDQAQTISDCDDYLKNHDGSLCYFYHKEGEDGVATALTYTLDGGKLTFEADSLGSFAIAAKQRPNILLEPIFWLIAIFGLFLLILIIRALSRSRKYKVVFYTNGGSRVRTVRAKFGACFAMPADPKKEGYTFAGWFEDKALTRRFIATSITRRRKLKAYARWMPVPVAPVEQPIEEPVAPVEEAVAPVEEAVAPVEEAVAPVVPVEEPGEEAVAPVVPVEEPVEEAVEEPAAPTEEQLLEYYKKIRCAVLGYALAEPNEKVSDGMLLMRAFKKTDGVYVYLALDPEANGIDKAEGALAAETPAMTVVTDDEKLGNALALIDKMMTELGLEKTGEEVGELSEGTGTGFGYRLAFEN